MGLSYVMLSDDLVVVECTDGFRFEDWAAGIEQLLDDPAYNPRCRILLDRRAATSADSTRCVEQVVDFLDRHRPRLGDTRWAILVGGHDLSYGVARMLAMRASVHGVQMEAFADFSEAMCWLEIEASSV